MTVHKLLSWPARRRFGASTDDGFKYKPYYAKGMPSSYLAVFAYVSVIFREKAEPIPRPERCNWVRDAS
jgi:hypothetical protein